MVMDPARLEPQRHCTSNYRPVLSSDRASNSKNQNNCFLDFAHCTGFYILENITFRKEYLFPSSGDERETPVPGPVIKVRSF
jgi:hypothetical protein